jgi:uncharacterized protein with PQ loop repeat
MDLTELSYILSTISLVFYSIVYVPQFYVIYKSKSSSGISFWMLLLWSQADILSLIGTILLYMPLSIIVIGWYHFFIGALMIVCVLFYADKYTIGDIESQGKRMSNGFIKQCVATVLFLILNTVICLTLQMTIKKSYDEIGSILGWITMVFYSVGRLPQIWLNYKRRSTEGLSLLMYIFTMCGNIIYLAVITMDPLYINMNLPWIINCGITISMDIFVIFQHYYYNKS